MGELTTPLTNQIPLVEELNGIKLVYQRHPGIRSVAFLVAASVGSAVESPDLSGISHFIEHAAFKGTKSRSPYQIKLPIERAGGHLNAFTSRVATVYYMHIPYDVFDETADILLDLYSNPLFDSRAVELEKSVILEEIREALDEPSDVVFDQLTKTVWGEAFGKPILGSMETVSRFTREDLIAYHNTNYVSGRTTVVVFGNFEPEKVKKHVREFADGIPDGPAVEPPSPPPPPKNAPKNLILSHKKDLNQVHIVFFKPMPGRKSGMKPIMDILNTALGSGMSSLLFEHIREKRGLAYTIGTDMILYREGGGLFIYASTSTDKFWQLSNELKDIFERLLNHGMDRDVFEYGKNRLIGGLELSSERALSNAFRLLDDTLNMEEPRSLDRILQELREIDLERMNNFLREHLGGQWWLSAVGPEGFDPSQVVDQWKL
ncbi:MAG: hypothetical protein PWP37_1166 [Thermotogota bacterium]|nr:hypothetical protein [Thermotogota bacterium]MDK2864974.1 hypothetical protein [Thermotogota bacterium]